MHAYCEKTKWKDLEELLGNEEALKDNGRNMEQLSWIKGKGKWFDPL